MEQGLDDIVVKHLQLEAPHPDMREWDWVVENSSNTDNEITIAMVGKYVSLKESYKSLSEALIHAGIHTRTRVNIEYVDAEEVEKDRSKALGNCDAILIPGGFGKRGTEGKIKAAQYARENKVPYLGICLGMQVATIEFARHIAGLKGANSTEFDPGTEHPVIALISEWTTEEGTVETRDEDSDMGGTMRLGAQLCGLKHESHGKFMIQSRFTNVIVIVMSLITITSKNSNPTVLYSQAFPKMVWLR